MGCHHFDLSVHPSTQWILEGILGLVFGVFYFICSVHFPCDMVGWPADGRPIFVSLLGFPHGSAVQI